MKHIGRVLCTCIGLLSGSFAAVAAVPDAVDQGAQMTPMATTTENETSVPAPADANIPNGMAQELKIGQPVPDFVALDRHGKEVRLSDFRGKIVMLDIWSTWCGPCVAGMPSLEALHRQFKDQDVVVLALDSSDSKAVWEKWLKANPKYTMTFLHDPPDKKNGAGASARLGNIPDLYGVSGLPAKFVIDKEGILVGRGGGGGGNNPTARANKSWDGVLGPVKEDEVRLLRQARLPLAERRERGFAGAFPNAAIFARPSAAHPGDAAFEALSAQLQKSEGADAQAQATVKFILDFPTHPRLMFAELMTSGTITMAASHTSSAPDPQFFQNRRVKFQQLLQAKLADSNTPAAAREQMALIEYEMAIEDARAAREKGRRIDLTALQARIDRLASALPQSKFLGIMKEDLEGLAEETATGATGIATMQ